MKKSYWFEHDYNAANDAKILFLRQQLGMEGYGIYWFIVEQLVQAGGKLPLKVVPVLAMQSQTQESKVSVIITSYELFEIEDGHFFSIRLNEHIETRAQFSEMGKIGAKKRWGNGEAISGGNRGAIREGNKGGYAKTDRQTDIRGISFSENGLAVIFPNGESQPLGQGQLIRKKEGTLQPHFIKLGSID